MSQVIDRAAASKINPLISPVFTEDTLADLATLTRDLGYLLSQVAHAPAGSDPVFADVYLICLPMAAALAWESKNIHSCDQSKREPLE